MAGYYYRQLDREKRAVYDAMRTGMEALAPGSGCRSSPARSCRTSTCG